MFTATDFIVKYATDVSEKLHMLDSADIATSLHNASHVLLLPLVRFTHDAQLKVRLPSEHFDAAMRQFRLLLKNSSAANKDFIPQRFGKRSSNRFFKNIPVPIQSLTAFQRNETGEG